jgi:hypothetical protein
VVLLSKMVKPLKRKRWNYRAMGKVAIVVGIVIFGMVYHHPAIHVAGLYVQDVGYYTHNNSTKMEFHNLSAMAKMAFIAIPFYYIVPVIGYYVVVTRMHRKKLILNGSRDGVVMLGINDYRFKGHIYDLISISKGCRHFDWGMFPKLYSNSLYDGKTTLYYKITWLQSPLEWNRVMANDSKQVRVGLYTVWVEGKYQVLVPHQINPILSYVLMSNENPYETKDPDLDKLKIMHRDTLKRIKQNNLEMLEGNPSIAGDMVRSGLFNVPSGTKKEFMDLLTDEEREKYIRESKGTG